MHYLAVAVVLYMLLKPSSRLFFSPGKVGDASLLRFLVDLRGEDSSNKQLRDDLMTMLIAGHETTAAVLTWALFEVAQNPELCKKLQQGTYHISLHFRFVLD